MSGQPLGIALSIRTVESRPTIRKHELWLCTNRGPSLTTRQVLSQKMPGLISLGKDATSPAAPLIVIVDPTIPSMPRLYLMELSLISYSALVLSLSPDSGSPLQSMRSRRFRIEAAALA